MSTTTYNAGVSTRKAIGTGAKKTAEGAKTALRGITDFFRGLGGAAPSAPTAEVIARKAATKAVVRKPAAKKPAAKK